MAGRGGSPGTLSTRSFIAAGGAILVSSAASVAPFAITQLNSTNTIGGRRFRGILAIIRSE